MPTANTATGGQFPKPSYNAAGYGSTNYDALTQASQDYAKVTYPSSVNPQAKTQNIVNAPPPSAANADISTSVYGKGHVALNKVNVSCSGCLFLSEVFIYILIVVIDSLVIVLFLIEGDIYLMWIYL